MEELKFSFKETFVALLACVATMLFCSEADTLEALAWSKGIAVLLGVVCWRVGRKLKV